MTGKPINGKAPYHQASSVPIGRLDSCVWIVVDASRWMCKYYGLQNTHKRAAIFKPSDTLRDSSDNNWPVPVREETMPLPEFTRKLIETRQPLLRPGPIFAILTHGQRPLWPNSGLILKPRNGRSITWIGTRGGSPMTWRKKVPTLRSCLKDWTRIGPGYSGDDGKIDILGVLFEKLDTYLTSYEPVHDSVLKTDMHRQDMYC